MHTIPHVLWGVSKHVAFGYLVYSVIQHRRGRAPTGGTVSVLLFGVLFPDVIDKSLVAAGLVGYGRSFAHSTITASALVLLVGRLSRRWNRSDLGFAFGVGYLSHLPVDMYGPLLTGSQSMDTAFLFWPILVEFPLGVMTPRLPVSRSTIFTAIVVVALALWFRDRMPVASDVARRLSARVDVPGGKRR